MFFYLGYNSFNKTFKIIDGENQIKEVTFPELKQNKYYNIEINKNNIIGTNGNLTRYPIFDGSSIKNNNIIILKRINDEKKYSIATYNEYLGIKTEIEIIHYINKHKIKLANGKIVENRYISSIKNEYPILNIKNNSKNFGETKKSNIKTSNINTIFTNNKLLFPQLNVSKSEILKNKSLSTFDFNFTDDFNNNLSQIVEKYDEFGRDSKDLVVSHQLQKSEDSPIIGYTIENKNIFKPIKLIINDNVVELKHGHPMDLPNKYVFLLFNRPEYFFKASNGYFKKTQDGYKFSKNLIYKEI